MEIVTKVMEKSWKSHGNLLVKMCTNPDKRLPFKYDMLWGHSYLVYIQQACQSLHHCVAQNKISEKLLVQSVF